MDLSVAARLLSAELRGGDGRFLGVSTDTRTLEGGQLFVALKGPRFDGHAFLKQARAGAAAGALVEHFEEEDIRQIRCADTLVALGQLAGAWRDQQGATVIGITGSNGKTTVKGMLASILGTGASTLATVGNLNNEIGLPLTLCALNPQHRYAVIEMGAARPGDIAYLAAIARPSVAIVNNAAAAHLEGMGSVAGVARVKGELIAALPEDGIAVINGDDDHADYWRELAGERQRIEFGFDPGCAVRASYRAVEKGLALSITTPAGVVEATIRCLGEHNVMNALAACAAAVALRRPLEEIARGLEAFQPVGGRWRPRPMAAGWTLIEDTYNANPASLVAGLRAAAQLPGELWLVLGDMAELGPDAPALHFQAGAEARRAGVVRLYGLGELARDLAAGFGEGARAFGDREALIAELRAALEPGVVCLIKGSRAMHMEDVVQALAGS